MVHTRTSSPTYSWSHNLVLAWIPLGLSVLVQALDGLRSRGARIAAALCLAAWLAFFPNAPYLMTDLLHLKVRATGSSGST